MAATVFTPTAPGQTATLALTTSESTLTLRNAQSGAKYVDVWASDDWLYSPTTSGTFVAIKAYQVYRRRVDDNGDIVLYAKHASSTATLYALSARD